MITKQIIPAALMMTLIASAVLFCGFREGENYSGFKLLEKRFVKEVNAECFLFEHVKSGARLLKIAADDDNKTFSIAFKTMPESDAGEPHIMEHAVLNGSKNFPVKSPFDVLFKGSLNTFLNAFTGSDITIYPFASMNDKDYFNLMHVYLDAVLNPLIYDDPRILKQEGWHHELTDHDGAVVYKGVVYNEMKGAYSSPTRELGYQIDKHLFPDNNYRFSSGGYPEAIPTLTYEAFLDFHRKYYHPSNSYIFLYGDANLEKELAFIDSEYLSKYSKSDDQVTIPLQPSFKKMKEVRTYYSAAEGSETAGQTYLSLNFVAGQNVDQKLSFALDIISEVLVNQESAPVRLALQEANVGREVRASVEDLKQNVFQIRVQNANAEDKSKFYEIVMNTLSDAAKNGLDKDAVAGTLNRIEFRLREGDDAQKGLTYNFQAINGWFYADDPFLTLAYEKPLAEIKKGIQKGFLEEVIQKYFLENHHALLMVLEPKPGMEKEINAKDAKTLSAFKASLSLDDMTKLIKETEELIAYQKREDTPEALATIPMLDLEDINPKAVWYGIEEKKVADIPVLYHDTFSNNVVYVRLNYDVRVLPSDLIPYAAILAEVMGSMDTKNYLFGDLDMALNTHTGSFDTFLNTYLVNLDDNELMPKFIVESKAMNNKVDKMLELMNEIVNHSKYNDLERLKAVLIRHQSRLDSQAKRDGFGLARTRMFSYFSNQGKFDELTSGADYYWLVTELVNHFDEKAETIVENLNKVASLLFTKENLITSVTCSADDYKGFAKSFTSFAKSQPTKEVKYYTWKFDLGAKQEGILTASKVQYVFQGYDFKKLGYEWNGKMRVLDQIISRDWLQNQVRVIGGAYGGFSNFSSNGLVYFGSYRDPNLKETLENYDGTTSYLNRFDVDKKDMTRFIIGTIARLDRPLTPSRKGNVAVERYFEKVTPGDLQKERDAILTTTPADMRAMEKMVADILAQDAYCVYGNEEKLQGQKELFEALIPLSK